jgi:hypothetical protein
VLGWIWPPYSTVTDSLYTRINVGIDLGQCIYHSANSAAMADLALH